MGTQNPHIISYIDLPLRFCRKVGGLLGLALRKGGQTWVWSAADQLRFLLFLIYDYFTYCLMSEFSREALVTFSHAMNSSMVFSCVRGWEVVTFDRKKTLKQVLLPFFCWILIDILCQQYAYGQEGKGSSGVHWVWPTGWGKFFSLATLF